MILAFPVISNQLALRFTHPPIVRTCNLIDVNYLFLPPPIRPSGPTLINPNRLRPFRSASHCREGSSSIANSPAMASTFTRIAARRLCRPAAQHFRVYPKAATVAAGMGAKRWLSQSKFKGAEAPGPYVDTTKMVEMETESMAIPELQA